MATLEDQQLYYIDQPVEIIKSFPLFNLSKIRIIKTQEVLSVQTCQLKQTKSADTYLTIKL